MAAWLLVAASLAWVLETAKREDEKEEGLLSLAGSLDAYGVGCEVIASWYQSNLDKESQRSFIMILVTARVTFSPQDLHGRGFGSDVTILRASSIYVL